ncbi:MAG: fused MFS/spermidine synthase [Nitrospirota bacterium]|nr:fused MFS/spermidine synthase [Nitrospirota bacterium]MDH5297167.1 fused MFS/spermidine synthase [Nitrospirota bacterium]
MTRPSLTQSSLPRWWCFATAFTTGAVVMALEILGSRLLAPVFGSSLFVWGALIGVILAAMSSGYAAGGWLADRSPPQRVLAGLLLVSGAWTLLLAWSGQPVVFRVAQWIQDPRWGPCFAASVLLAVPAFGLSGVLPALLRLAIGDMGHLGRHTGGMIAVSTIGSLVGTWGTSFYLLTWLGSTTLVAVLGVVQVCLGLLWTLRLGSLPIGLQIILFAGVGGMTWMGFHPVIILPPALHQEDSPYQQVRVSENDLFRYLILDNTFHAVMWKAAPTFLALPYSQVMMGVLPIVENPKRGLILGHGGGSLAKWLGENWPDLELDVIEMDPSVVQAAERYFGYTPPPNHHVYVQDARTFLRNNPTMYDVVWVDVFARHLIPFHVTTREFFEELRMHVNSKGAVAVNLASSDAPANVRRAQAVLTTMQLVFPDVVTYGVAGPEWLKTKKGSVNLIFFGGEPVQTMRDSHFLDVLIRQMNRNRFPPEGLGFFMSQEPVVLAPGDILTDDFSPLDLLQGEG